MFRHDKAHTELTAPPGEADRRVDPAHPHTQETESVAEAMVAGLVQGILVGAHQDRVIESGDGLVLNRQPLPAVCPWLRYSDW
jgi:hypothetical protein